MKRTWKCGLAIAFAACIAASGAFAETIAAGDLFKGRCAGCHGPDGSGNTPFAKAFKIRDLGSSDVQKQSDEEILRILSGGKGKMPAFDGKLNAAQMGEIVSHIRALAKKK